MKALLFALAHIASGLRLSFVDNSSAFDFSESSQALTGEPVEAPPKKEEVKASFSEALDMLSGEAPKPKASAAQKSTSMASVPLKNINNVQYIGEVYFGNPP
mmetsp:Transcript_18722/g.28717  ORF Transcript_18722/g.28717 Transcript_18722/m.28717 type:complete len:102 (+) Transcript_18722:2-307(+)